MIQRYRYAFVLLFAALVVYALTLDNGLQPHELHGGDLITHQYAQVQGRPSNAPGYPLYTMGGWLWFHTIRQGIKAAGVQHPNPIPILSSYSALWALAALWLLYQITIETTRSRRAPAGNEPVAVLIAFFYATTYFFWYYATTTEQYTSAVAHTLAILYAFIHWDREPDNLRRLYALAFLCGLSLAHMLTVALIVPPIVAAVLWRKPRLLQRPGIVFRCVGAAALPLLSYIYVFVRGMQHPEWRGAGEWASGVSWFFAFVSTAQGREELLWGFEPGRSFFGNGFPDLIVQELGWLMLVSGLVGIAVLRRPLPAILYATLSLYTVFSWAYRYGNWFQVILPAYPLVLIGSGAAADWLQALPTRYGNRRSVGWARATYIGPLLILGLAILWRVQASLPAANSRNRPEDTALQRAAVLVDQPLPPGAALFASVDDALALQYLTSIWQLRPDLRVVSRAEADQTLEQSPVFAAWDAVPTLLAELELSAAPTVQAASPDWLALVPAKASADLAPWDSATDTVVDQVIVDGLSLRSYSVTPSPAGSPVNRNHPTSSFDVTLHWQIADGRWPDALRISVRPTLNGHFVFDGDSLVQIDRSQPADGLASTIGLSEPTSVIDPYRLPVLPDGLPRPDGVAVIVYQLTDAGFEDIARVDLALPQP